jgi:hypothetical protein
MSLRNLNWNASNNEKNWVALQEDLDYYNFKEQELLDNCNTGEKNIISQYHNSSINEIICCKEHNFVPNKSTATQQDFQTIVTHFNKIFLYNYLSVFNHKN